MVVWLLQMIMKPCCGWSWNPVADDHETLKSTRRPQSTRQPRMQLPRLPEEMRKAAAQAESADKVRVLFFGLIWTDPNRWWPLFWAPFHQKSYFSHEKSVYNAIQQWKWDAWVAVSLEVSTTRLKSGLTPQLACPATHAMLYLSSCVFTTGLHSCWWQRLCCCLLYSKTTSDSLRPKPISPFCCIHDGCNLHHHHILTNSVSIY